MSNREYISQRIEQYLDGSLTAEEMKSFEDELASNQFLAQELEIHRAANEAMNDYSLLAFENKISRDLQKRRHVRQMKRATIIVFLVASITGLFVLLVPGDKIVKPIDQKEVNVDAVEEVINANHTPETSSKEPLNGDRVVDQLKPLRKNVATVNESSDVSFADSSTRIVEVSDSANLLTETPSIKVADTSISLKETTVEQHPDPCLNVKIRAEVLEKLPCVGQLDGSISFNRTNGSTPPYAYSVDGGKTYSNRSTFEGLGYGTYDLVVKDANQCWTSVDTEFRLDEKECFIPDEAFSPDFDVWEYKIESGQVFDLSFIDKRGQLVKEFKNTTAVLWDGTNSNGVRVDVGLYLYIVKSKSGETKKGYVTVMP